MKALLAIFLLLAPVAALAEQAVLIDVRTPEEFSQGHLAGALLMPHGDIAHHVADAGLAPDTPITLYCKSGRRAELARQKLLELGYTDVTNAGGYEALAAQADTETGCIDGTC